MKRFIFVISALLIVNLLSIAQEDKSEEFTPSGNAFGKVFWNYNLNLSENANQVHTFAIQRVYLGYKHNLSEDISMKITFDGVGKDSRSSKYNVFVKTAQLDWRVAPKVRLSMGLIGLKQFKDQESFWGYRYIYKSFQDEFALGTSADLGVNGEIILTDKLKTNLFVLNGEGYTKLQDDMGRLKVGGNLIFEPVDGLILKGYYDIYGGKFQVNDSVIVNDTTAIQTIAFFGGYNADKFRIGAEYNIQLNGKKYYQIAADHHLSGLAVYGTYIINKKFEVFGEWMQFKSNKLEGAETTWNNEKDGNILVAGIQFMPVRGVKSALNYRTFLFDNSAINTESYIYLNFEFAF